MRVFFAPLRVFCATLRVIFAHRRVFLAELPRSCLLSVGVFQTVKGTSKVIVGTPVEIERMLFPGRAGRPTSCAKRAFRGAVVRRRQPQGRRHPRPYPLDPVKAVPPPLPTPIYRWEGVVGVGVGMSRRHPNARTPRHFPHIPRAERVREADALAGVQFAHIPRPKVVRNADALAGVQFWFRQVGTALARL